MIGKGEKTENILGKEWLKREMRPYRGNVVFLTFLTVFSVLLSLSFSYILQYVINSAAAKEKKLLLIFSAVVLAVVVVRVLTQTLLNYLSEKYRAKITVGLRNRTFQKILRSQYAHAEKYHSGDLLNRMTSDVNEVAADSVSILPAVVGMIVQCIGAISALLLLDPLFTLVFTLGGIAVGGVSALFRKKVKKYHKEQVEADGKSRSFTQESIASLLTVKAYGAEGKAGEKSAEILDEYYRRRMKKNRLNAYMRCSFSFLSSASTVFAVVWSSIRVMSGYSDYGSILSVVMLLGQLQHPFASFSAVLPVVYARAASAERLAEADSMPEDNLYGENAVEYGALKAFQVRDLSFGYGRSEILSHAEATVEKGKIVCITGESGSGKSTLFKLLLSVYHPTGGGIYAQTADGAETPVTGAQRRLFAYVPQGNFLFSGTIYENLAFFAGEDKAKDEQFVQGALQAACAQFVYELPDGLNTSLKERGGGLSEGQLQRLAIARALLSDRPVLLLDEATSALDGETEKEVLENIRKTQGRTCLIVTHRPAALAIADEIWEVKDGKIRSERKA